MTQTSEPRLEGSMPAPDRATEPITLPREWGCLPASGGGSPLDQGTSPHPDRPPGAPGAWHDPRLGPGAGAVPRWLAPEMSPWQLAPAALLVLWALVALLRAV